MPARKNKTVTAEEFNTAVDAQSPVVSEGQYPLAWKIVVQSFNDDYNDPQPIPGEYAACVDHTFKYRIGEWATLRNDGKLVLCQNGLHSSRTLGDANYYVSGTHLMLVEVRGEALHDIGRTFHKSVHREIRPIMVWSLDDREEVTEDIYEHQASAKIRNAAIEFKVDGKTWQEHRLAHETAETAGRDAYFAARQPIDTAWQTMHDLASQTRSDALMAAYAMQTKAYAEADSALDAARNAADAAFDAATAPVSALHAAAIETLMATRQAAKDAAHAAYANVRAEFGKHYDAAAPTERAEYLKFMLETFGTPLQSAPVSEAV